jgi:hypothetical protein
MFRRSDLQRVGHFGNYTWVTDWEMWLRLLSIGDCYVVPEVLSYVRNHEGQVTKMAFKAFISYLEEYRMVKDIKENNEYGVDFSILDIDKVVRRKATDCAKAIPVLFKQLKLKENRNMLMRVLKITISEKVVLQALNLYLRKQLRVSREPSYQLS